MMTMINYLTSTIRYKIYRLTQSHLLVNRLNIEFEMVEYRHSKDKWEASHQLTTLYKKT